MNIVQCQSCAFARAIPLQPGHRMCMHAPPQMAVLGNGQAMPIRPIVETNDFCADGVALPSAGIVS